MLESQPVLLDAGMLIGTLLRGDLLHSEARPLVEAARQGVLPACTTVGILSEVYAALTWINRCLTRAIHLCYSVIQVDQYPGDIGDVFLCRR